ncbi:MAG: hypothetical protein WB930_11365 [Syntrophobacteraceae bacterium]
MTEDPRDRMMRKPLDQLPIFKEAEKQGEEVLRPWKHLFFVAIGIGIGIFYMEEGLRGILIMGIIVGFFMLCLILQEKWNERQRRKNPIKFWRL